ncbi:hypothetical protein [Nonomuraea guangzhouensis]|uniref:HTH lysR-type domain-containing protein n=1 Tax=Nonomuraea guangzhouensis TaxID=1291555 RepID=A0ABW4GWD9_9ACTN
MEDALGAELFMRTSRSVALTPAGETFLEAADRPGDAIQNHARRGSGHLRLPAVGPHSSGRCPRSCGSC